MSIDTNRRRGVALAFGAATISGIAVFVNGYGVAAVPDATVYTTAKNLVAALLLTVAAVAAYRRRPAARPRRPSPAQLGGLLAIGIVGGAVAFVLFFEGLARASSTQAAFVHKTLVVWVALLAVPLLGERLGWPHLGAIALLVSGQAVLGGGLASFRAGGGEILILAATLLWAAEAVVAKRLLRDVAPTIVGLARMGIGAVVLVGWVVASGRWDRLAGLDVRGWAWAALTGAVLAGYVATWLAALALAPAVDVTAVLVLAAVITAWLAVAVKGTAVTAPTTVGGLLVLAGAVLVAAARPRPVLATVRE